MLYNKKCFFYFSTTARNCLLTQHVINMMMIMTILSACGRWLCIEYIAEILFAVNMEGRKYTEINTSPRPGSHHKPGQHWWDWGGAITGSFRPLQSCSVRAAINWKRCETARISAGKWGHDIVPDNWCVVWIDLPTYSPHVRNWSCQTGQGRDHESWYP